MKKKNYFLRASVLRIVLSFFLRIPVNAKWVLTRPADVSTSIKQNKTETYVAYLDNDSNRFTSIEAALSAATNAVANDNSKHQVVVIPQTEKQNGKDVAVSVTIEHDCSITNNVELVLPYYKSPTDKTLVTYFDNGGDSHSFEEGGLISANASSNDCIVSIQGEEKDSEEVIIKNPVTRTIESGGILRINGQVTAAGGESTSGAVSGRTTGSYAELQMGTNAKLLVNNGATLYSWGFITEEQENNGSLIESSGGIIYEPFVVYDWRGGSASLQIATNTTSNLAAATAWVWPRNVREVFPMHKFDAPNIMPERIFSGSGSLYGRLSLYRGSEGTFITEVKILVGSSGLISYSSGSCSWNFKKGTNNNNKTAIKLINGNGSVGELSVKIKVSVITADVNTSDFYLPIGGQFDICIEQSSFSFNKKTRFLPGSKLTITSGSTVNVTESFAAFYSPDDANTTSGDAEIINNGRIKFKCDKSSRIYSGSFGAKIKGTGTIASSGSDSDYSKNHSVSLKSNYSGSVVSYKFHLQKI